MWIQLELDRLCLSPLRPNHPLPWPSAEDIETARAAGWVEAVTVRTLAHTQPTRYEIVAGEHHWLTAQKAGLATIEARVRDDLDDAGAHRLLNRAGRAVGHPLQAAHALQARVRQGMSIARAGATLGYTRTVASHLLRLLRLEPGVQQGLAEGWLAVGQAKVLVGLSPAQQREAARRVRWEKLTARQVEALARRLRQGESTEPESETAVHDDDHARLEKRLAEQLGVPVQLEYGPTGSGRLLLRFADLAVLEGLLERLGYRDDTE